VVPLTHFITPSIINSSNIKKYSFLLKDNFFDDYSNKISNSINNDGTCLWFTNLPRNTYKSAYKLKFKSLTYILSNWIDDLFPSVIYICIDGISGFIDK
jgi:replicative superfamily II helicase